MTPPVHGEGPTVWGQGPARLSSETPTARLEGALPPTRYPVARSTRVTSTAPPIRPATVSPSPSPTRSRRSAMAGRSPSSWVIVILPRPSRRPFLRRLLWRNRALILVVPVWRVVPQVAVDRPVDGCAAHAQVGAPGSWCGPRSAPGGAGAGPVSTGPPAPSAGDRPTRPGDLAHPHMVPPHDHDVLALSQGKDDGIGGPWHSSRR